MISCYKLPVIPVLKLGPGPAGYYAARLNTGPDIIVLFVLSELYHILRFGKTLFDITLVENYSVFPDVTFWIDFRVQKRCIRGGCFFRVQDERQLLPLNAFPNQSQGFIADFLCLGYDKSSYPRSL